MSLSWLFNGIVSALLLPPLNGLLLVLVGLLALPRRPRLGRLLVVSGVLVVSLLSLGVVARALLVPLEARHPPFNPDAPERASIGAVVVLGGGRYRNAPEFGDDDIAGAALDRLRYAALLARHLQRPLLVTGGAPEGGGRSEAEAMQRSLQRDFGVQVRWLENRSVNTAENARLSADILAAAGVSRVVLVTHAWHMPRAVLAFSATGLDVVPAPTVYSSTGAVTPLHFVPRAAAMQESARAMHEWIGIAWYHLRH